jgi:hypothetical protein
MQCALCADQNNYLWNYIFYQQLVYKIGGEQMDRQTKRQTDKKIDKQQNRKTLAR